LEEPVEDSLPLSERLPASSPDALDEVLRSEQVSLVQTALESQPPAYREILSLRFEEEMKLDEIAGLLGIPLSTVKSRLGRALEHLRASYLRRQAEGVTA